MGSVPTESLCALTNLIKVTALHMALFNIFDIHTGTKVSTASNLHAHLLKLTKKERDSYDLSDSISSQILLTKRPVNSSGIIFGKRPSFFLSFNFGLAEYMPEVNDYHLSTWLC